MFLRRSSCHYDRNMSILESCPIKEMSSSKKGSAVEESCLSLTGSLLTEGPSFWSQVP